MEAGERADPAAFAASKSDPRHAGSIKSKGMGVASHAPAGTSAPSGSRPCIRDEKDPCSNATRQCGQGEIRDRDKEWLGSLTSDCTRAGSTSCYKTVRSCADAPVRTEPQVGGCDSPLILPLISDPYLVLTDLLRFLRSYSCTDADPIIPDT